MKMNRDAREAERTSRVRREDPDLSIDLVRFIVYESTSPRTEYRVADTVVPYTHRARARSTPLPNGRCVRDLDPSWLRPLHVLCTIDT